MLYKRLIAIGLATLLIFSSGGLQALAGVVRVISPLPGAAVAGRVELSVGYESTAQEPVTKIVIELDGQAYGTRPINPPEARGVISIIVDSGELTNGSHGFGFLAYSRSKLVGKSYVKVQVIGGGTSGGGVGSGAPPKLDAGKVQAVNLRDGETLAGKRSVTIVPSKELGESVFIAVRIDGSLRYLSNRAPYQFLLDTTQLSDGKHAVDVQVRSAAQESLAARSYGIMVANAGTLASALERPAPTPEADRVVSVPRPAPTTPAAAKPSVGAARASEPKIEAPAVRPAVPELKKPAAVRESPAAVTETVPKVKEQAPKPPVAEVAAAAPVSQPEAPAEEPAGSPVSVRQEQPVLMAAVPKEPDVSSSGMALQPPTMPEPEPEQHAALAAPRAVETRFEAYGPRPVLTSPEPEPPAIPATDPPRPDETAADTDTAGARALAGAAAASRGSEPVAVWQEASAYEVSDADLRAARPPESELPARVTVSSEPSEGVDAASSAAGLQASAPEMTRMAMAPREAGGPSLARPAVPKPEVIQAAPAAPKTRTYVYSRPVVVSGSPLFGLREAVERLGGQVSWDNDTKVATATISGKTMKVAARSGEARGARGKIDGARVSLRKGHVFVTADAIASALGLAVDWDSRSRRVRMTRTVSL